MKVAQHFSAGLGYKKDETIVAKKFQSMSTPTAISFDMGATSVKTGVVRDGKIILRGEIIKTRRNGDTAALIDAFIQEIRRLKSIHPEAEAVSGTKNASRNWLVAKNRLGTANFASQRRQKQDRWIED